MNTSCHYTESQIEASGLLSEQRMAELKAAVDARISPACDTNGNRLNNAMVVDLGDGNRVLFPRVDTYHMEACMRREVWAVVLTEDELASINRHCLNAIEAKREAVRFAKAEKLTEWTEGVWLGDTYYHSMDDLLEALADSEGEWPDYVWAAQPQKVIGKFSAWEVCENMVADHGWEDMGEHDLDGLAELQAALDKFTEANASVLSYQTDYRKAILLAGFKAKAQA